MKTLYRMAVLLVGILLISGCQPEAVEVTRVITETITEEVEVTRVVEGEVVTEMVEVTRVIEVEAPEAAAPGERVTLRVAIDGSENSLNPYTYSSGYPGWNMLLLQYDTLMQFDTSGVPQPWLATNIETSEDGLTIVMDLRDDATWHDGEPFTSEDVKFTVEYYQEYNHGRWSLNTAEIASVETDGDYRVIFNMAGPTPGFEQGTLADTPILPMHIWESVTEPETHEFDTNIGTGPYKLVDMELEQFYVFEVNEDYWAGRPRVDELIFVQFADTAGLLSGLRTRAVDMIADPVGPEQIGVLADVDGIDVIQGPEFTTVMINYDLEQAPFNNKVVRQAMNLAIDRQEVIDTVYLGAASVGSPGWIHPASPRFNEDVEIVYDPELAAEMLDEAGIVDTDGDGIRELDGEPLSFEYLSRSSLALVLRVAEVTSQMLSEIGIEAVVTAVEDTTHIDALWPSFDVTQGRNYQMATFGWSAPAQANPLRMASLLHSDTGTGWLNLTGFSNERVDALGEALLSELDPEASGEILNELQAIVADELPFILLLYPDGAYAYWSEGYDGWEFMTGQGVFHKLSFLPEENRP